jgi:hypothetical protein
LGGSGPKGIKSRSDLRVPLPEPEPFGSGLGGGVYA